MASKLGSSPHMTMALVTVIGVLCGGAAGGVDTDPDDRQYLIPCGRYTCDARTEFCDDAITGQPECFLCSGMCERNRVGQNQFYISICLDICPVYWKRLEIQETATTPVPLLTQTARTQVVPAGSAGIVLSWAVLAALVMFLVVFTLMMLGAFIYIRRRGKNKLADSGRIVMRGPNVGDRAQATTLLTNPLYMEDELTTLPVYNTRITLSDQQTSTTELTGAAQRLLHSTRLSRESLPSVGAAESSSSGTDPREEARLEQGEDDPIIDVPQGAKDFYDTIRTVSNQATTTGPRVTVGGTWPRSSQHADTRV